MIEAAVAGLGEPVWAWAADPFVGAFGWSWGLGVSRGFCGAAPVHEDPPDELAECADGAPADNDDVDDDDAAAAVAVAAVPVEPVKGTGDILGIEGALPALFVEAEGSTAGAPVEAIFGGAPTMIGVVLAGAMDADGGLGANCDETVAEAFCPGGVEIGV